MSDNGQFGTLVTLITGTVKNLSLYPKTHPTIKTAVHGVNEILHSLLATRRELVVAVVKNTLLVDRTPFYTTTKGVEEFIDRLIALEINGIIFYRTINEKEILILLESLTIQPEELKKQKGLPERLKNMGVRGVEIKKIEEDVKVEIFKTYTAARNEIVNIMSELRLGHIPEKTKIQEMLNDLNEAMLKDKNTLLCLTMLQDYDEYTFNHSVNVGILSLSLAQELDFKGDDLLFVGLSGILHDIGKTRINRDIILKPSELSEYEWDEMRKHPVHGRDIIKEIGGISDITAHFVLYHHLRYNLSGYPRPDGIASQPEGSRIIAIADTYDSMTTLRPYQRRFDPKESMELLNSRVNEDFDMEYVKAFTKTLGIYPIGSVVRLDTNEIGVVTRTNDAATQRPFVKLILDASGNAIEQMEELSLEEKDTSTRHYKRTIVATVGSAQQGLIDLNRYMK
ncbi:MAG: HD domain-containing protein [Deltaproteobacteria bacterium]|nr:HD domain-containing protein [Deltaproteobacteria bacterium]MCL5276375.1 HD domain-containing protein [Deltaproteobacteria bacterium]